MMWYDGGWGWGGWFAMAVAMVVFWGLVVAGVLALAHLLGRNRTGPRPGADTPVWGQAAGKPAGGPAAPAEDVLADRFARGEIDEEEYRRRLAVLREHR
ncbi:SHOCT domain-containing protein [Streptacidiphilus sp. ASG 303]|uniref:SHOCT domain-containing protein n=1 Tax=Streptacidiphilus sp. ASG 303 TaxID=2896847 RepID=UPI001E486C29|nr:SHOCT domain-containing protein [Streptacidiphilus sp. ASG 303]MCD0485948.1 SHOCT domain-containing protein [Streptacidiphilus sp. ASG 303]